MKDRAGWLLYAGGMVAVFAFGLAFPLKSAFGGGNAEGGLKR